MLLLDLVIVTIDHARQEPTTSHCIRSSINYLGGTCPKDTSIYTECKLTCRFGTTPPSSNFSASLSAVCAAQDDNDSKRSDSDSVNNNSGSSDRKDDESI